MRSEFAVDMGVDYKIMRVCICLLSFSMALLGWSGWMGRAEGKAAFRYDHGLAKASYDDSRVDR